MAKVKYIGQVTERVLRAEDMTALGMEGHAELRWTRENLRTVEVDDKIAKALVEALPREFALLNEPDGGVAEDEDEEPKSEGKKKDSKSKGEAEAAAKP